MAVTTYTDKAHLTQTVAPGALSRMSPALVDQAIEDASRLADGYLSKRFTLPFIAVGGDVTLRVTGIAIWELLKGRVTTDNDIKLIRLPYEDAIKWFEAVAAGKINPDVTDSSSGATSQPQPPRAAARSASPRGFTSISDTGSCTGNTWDGWPRNR